MALTSQDPDATATAAAPAATTSYAGFNLLLLEPALPGTTAGTTELTYDARLFTNGGGGGRIRVRRLSDAERACGGLSNGVDGEGGDAWPKVVQGRAALRSILELERQEGHTDADQDQDQDQGGSSPGGPDHEIADGADAHLAERLIELLTYVTASCKRFWLFPLPKCLFFFSSCYHARRCCLFLCPRRAFHAS